MNSSRTSKQRRARQALVSTRRLATVVPKPPPFTSTIVVSKVFRFQATAAATHNLLNSDLGDLLCMAATTVSAYQIARAIKLSKIEMWGPPASTLVPVTVSCDFSGVTNGTFGSSRLKSDTSVGSTESAHIVARPDRRSQAAQWQPAASANVLCSISFPLNAIVDVHYSMAMQESAGVTAVTNAVVGATVGQLYLRALTSSSSTTILAPVSYITI